MLVAIMTMIRYLGGGLGRMPSVRRTTRFMKPRGFLRPDSSVSRAWRVPIPPPPPMPMPATMRLRMPPRASPSAELCSIDWRNRSEAVSFDRYDIPLQPVWAAWENGEPGAPKPCPPSGPPSEIWPRLPRESASSKKTMTPP